MADDLYELFESYHAEADAAWDAFAVAEAPGGTAEDMACAKRLKDRRSDILNRLRAALAARGIMGVREGLLRLYRRRSDEGVAREGPTRLAGERMSCIGCRHHTQHMVVSGQWPIHHHYCQHPAHRDPRAPEGVDDCMDFMGRTGATPVWCPILQDDLSIQPKR